MFFRRFQFLDPGPLVDDELELVAPHRRGIDDVLAACAHPLSQAAGGPDVRVTRQELEAFLDSAPGGREPAKWAQSGVPQYHFWMRLRDDCRDAPGVPPVRILGGIALRVGDNRAIRLYYGNVGYHVFPPARGRRYAERACRLLLPLAKRHKLSPLWITCNPDNLASRTTCERLGATLVGIVPVPEADPLYARGEHHKCRYRIEI